MEWDMEIDPGQYGIWVALFVSGILNLFALLKVAWPTIVSSFATHMQAEATSERDIKEAQVNAELQREVYDSMQKQWAGDRFADLTQAQMEFQQEVIRALLLKLNGGTSEFLESIEKNIKNLVEARDDGGTREQESNEFAGEFGENPGLISSSSD
jgi:hypothetical protein